MQSEPHKLASWRLWAGVAAAAVVALLAAVFFRPGAPRDLGKSEEGSVPVAEVRLDPPREKDGATLSNIRNESGAVVFTLRAPIGRTAATETPDTFFFAVPEGRAVRAELRSYRAGALQVKLPAPTDPPPDPASLEARLIRNLKAENKGVMRRWGIASLEIRTDFYSAWRRAGSTDADSIEAEIAIAWDQPFEAQDSPLVAHDMNEVTGWPRVMGALMSNPEGLARYGSDRPAVHEEIPSRLTAPWKTVPGDRRWARLRIREEGIYRLDVEDLISVGFAPSEIDPTAARVFSRGEPVPLFRVGSGKNQKVYLWNDKVRSPYSAERVFWVTLAADLPDSLLNPVDPATFAGEPRDVPVTMRVAVLDRDNQLLKETDNFLSLRKIEWVDAPVPVDGEFALPLDLPLYAGGDSPLRAKIRFYTQPTEDRGVSPQYRIALKSSGAEIAAIDVSVNWNQPQVFESDFALQPTSVHEGVNELALRREPAHSGPINAPMPLERIGGDDADADGWIWFDRIEAEYPARPALLDGKLVLRDAVDAPPAQAWTELDEATARAVDSSESAVIFAIAPDERVSGTLAVTRRDGRPGILRAGGAGHRVFVMQTSVIPKTPRFETVRIDDVTRAEEGADYLIVAHHEFVGGVVPLVALHEREGMRVRLVDVQSVYDAFSDGELSPEAIRSFLAYTLREWTGGAPSYVLLVGDASSDYHGLTRSGIENYVPSYAFQYRDDRWASDYWYGAVAGADDAAEFMIGRISVNNTKDLEAVVEKTVAYAERNKPGPWRARIGFVADNGEFPEFVESLRKDNTPKGYEPLRIYLDETMPLEDNWYLVQELVAAERLKISPIATAKIAQAFRQGVSYLTYYGHGSPNIWMDERVWFGADSQNSDNQHLAGSGHYAFVTTMTCNTGAIDYPVPDGSGVNVCISEDMMRVKDGGAVALYVPSGPSVTPIHQRMSVQLNRAIFDDGMRRFGEIATLTKARYSLLGHPEQLTYMFILLGDPAVALQLAPDPKTFALPNSTFRPGEMISVSLTGLEPARGRFHAALETGAAEVLWKSEEKDFSGGRIPLRFAIPQDAPLGDAVLRVYAWAPDGESEVVAASALGIERPSVLIGQTRVEPGSAGEHLLTVELINGNKLPVAAARLIAEPVGGGTKIEKQFTLDGDATTSITLSVPPPPRPGPEAGEAPPDEARVYEVRVALEGGSSYIKPARVALPPAVQWVGLVPQLSRIESLPDGKSVKVEAMVLAGEGAPQQWVVGLDDASGSGIRTQPLTLGPGQRGLAYFTLRSAEFDQATSGTLWLATVGRSPSTGGDRVDSTPVESIPFPRPRLRIAPESIKTSPIDPMDGQTIFVNFDVENVGDAESPAFTAALYDAPPEDGGKTLYSEIGSARGRQTALEPGGRRSIGLRYDPVNDAGENKFWVIVDPGAIRGKSSNEDLRAQASFRARTKFLLEVGETKVRQEGARSFLVGTVINKGESEARNVIVIFYRTGSKIRENQIGETTLGLVPPLSEVKAELLIEEPLIVQTTSPPSIGLRIKGSKQRISMLGEIEAE